MTILLDAMWVDVTFDGVVERPDEEALLEQREHLFGLGSRDDLEIHSEISTSRLRHAQPVHSLSIIGQHQTAGQVN